MKVTNPVLERNSRPPCLLPGALRSCMGKKSPPRGDRHLTDSASLQIPRRIIFRSLTIVIASVKAISAQSVALHVSPIFVSPYRQLDRSVILCLCARGAAPLLGAPAPQPNVLLGPRSLPIVSWTLPHYFLPVRGFLVVAFRPLTRLPHDILLVILV